MRRCAIAAISASLLIVSGCSTSTALSEAEYLKVLNATDGLENVDADTAKDLGGKICDAFDSGNDYVAVLDALTTDGIMDAGTAGSLIALSAAQYCSDNLADIPQP